MEIKLLSSFSEGSKAKSCSAEDSKTKINRKTKILEKKFIAMIIQKIRLVVFKAM
jgi:hypothetical protein